MNKIILTGDVHGDIVSRFSFKQNPFLRELDITDTIIQLGDFGCPWNDTTEKEDHYNLEWLSKKKWTTLVIPGNHDNYNKISELPLDTWNEGLVRKYSDNIMFAERGSIFNINGTRVLTISGAHSHDIAGGIAADKEEAKKFKKEGKVQFRVKDISWWEQEGISAEEISKILENIKAPNNVFDIVCTHDVPEKYLNRVSPVRNLFMPTFQEACLSMVENIIEYDKWYFGHFHANMTISDNMKCLYKDFCLYDKDKYIYEEEILNDKTKDNEYLDLLLKAL